MQQPTVKALNKVALCANMARRGYSSKEQRHRATCKQDQDAMQLMKADVSLREVGLVIA